MLQGGLLSTAADWRPPTVISIKLYRTVYVGNEGDAIRACPAVVEADRGCSWVCCEAAETESSVEICIS